MNKNEEEYEMIKKQILKSIISIGSIQTKLKLAKSNLALEEIIFPNLFNHFIAPPGPDGWLESGITSIGIKVSFSGKVKKPVYCFSDPEMC